VAREEALLRAASAEAAAATASAEAREARRAAARARASSSVSVTGSGGGSELAQSPGGARASRPILLSALAEAPLELDDITTPAVDGASAPARAAAAAAMLSPASALRHDLTRLQMVLASTQASLNVSWAE
jgi:hypothetical protein